MNDVENVPVYELYDEKENKKSVLGRKIKNIRLEKGQRIPNVFTILKIAKMGNMTVEEFLS